MNIVIIISVRDGFLGSGSYPLPSLKKKINKEIGQFLWSDIWWGGGGWGFLVVSVTFTLIFPKFLEWLISLLTCSLELLWDILNSATEKEQSQQIQPKKNVSLNSLRFFFSFSFPNCSRIKNIFRQCNSFDHPVKYPTTLMAIKTVFKRVIEAAGLAYANKTWLSWLLANY